MDNSFYQQLNQQDFDYIRSIVYKESGIKLSEMKRALVQSRLLRRMRELGMHCYEEYCDFLRENYDDEIENLINCITTNKTEFFREREHFSILQRIVEHELSHKNITLWSAGCSTGEEAYSMAIVLFECNFKRHFSIIATDIDTKVLDIAQKGIYPIEAVQDIGTNILKKYFLKGKDQYAGYTRVKDFLKSKISFQHQNLLDERYGLNKYIDVIFCRNVMIYFDKDGQNKILHKFYNQLSNGGYLFLGFAESIVSANLPFQYIAHSVYKKVGYTNL